ncbi:flavodoxin family protein [Occultella glacieicola]|uniref:Flavodoxin family protein n=1 Tax=Occultella glacieicola TaxID=2518684 RepID=A0ABY2E976_9MICO|nr:NAD(P)H-dependent oxidoreductase [Occultella glacieicola]TDE99059.1 flavodoxin family protein [Occultella glacieicola]
MNVLWVLAHPEQRSLAGALHADGFATLRAAGHAVEVDDLYAMKWKAVLDADDYPEVARGSVLEASGEAYARGGLSPDILAEHEKIARADAIVLQFPLWWFGMPAILKGWFDRVFVRGYAYDMPDPDRPGHTMRYGRGNLAGKRALVVVTTGAGAGPFGPRGIHGDLDEVLFPLLHGTLWYAGISALPPVAIHGTSAYGEADHAAAVELLRTRLGELATAEPIPFRLQGPEDYDRDLALRPELAPGRTGLSVHRH